MPPDRRCHHSGPQSLCGCWKATAVDPFVFITLGPKDKNWVWPTRSKLDARRRLWPGILIVLPTYASDAIVVMAAVASPELTWALSLLRLALRLSRIDSRCVAFNELRRTQQLVCRGSHWQPTWITKIPGLDLAGLSVVQCLRRSWSSIRHK